MIYFLYSYEQRRYGYGILQEILCELSSLPEGGTADPAFWIEWNDAVKKILQEQNSGKHADEVLGISVTKLQAFKAMVQFFKDYYERGPEPGITILFDYLHILPDGSSDSLAIREKWKICVDSALKEQPDTRKYLILGGG